MRTKKTADRTFFSANVLQFSENLIKKLENIKNINPQPRVTLDKQPEKKKFKIQDNYSRGMDANDKENQLHQLLSSMNIKDLCEINSENSVMDNSNIEFSDNEFPSS